MSEKEEKDYTIEELKTLHVPSKVTDDTISRLLYAFENDFTNEEAARYAGISPASYYNYYKMSSELREKVDASKDFVFVSAKKLIKNAIDNGSVDNAWELLKRRQKSLYSARSEIADPEGKPLNSGIDDSLKTIATSIMKLLNDDSGETTSGEASS